MYQKKCPIPAQKWAEQHNVKRELIVTNVQIPLQWYHIKMTSLQEDTQVFATFPFQPFITQMQSLSKRKARNHIM